MSDCISRQAVQDYIAEYLSQFLYDDVREVVETIDAYIGDMPSVTPTERIGHWIKDDSEDIAPIWGKIRVCSNCAYLQFNETNYCPNCGARMEGE